MEKKPTDLRRVLDVLFVGSAVLFNLLVSGIFLSMKFGNMILIQVFGTLVLLLAIPFTVTLVGYVREKVDRRVIVSHGVILFYLFLEVLLDYILLVPFRDILVLHVLYIIVEYAALFSMIGVAFILNRKMGWVVSVAFWILLASLIYLYVF